MHENITYGRGNNTVVVIEPET